jgi:FAD/FMN-containing dehydrogenase
MHDRLRPWSGGRLSRREVLKAVLASAALPALPALASALRSPPAGGSGGPAAPPGFPAGLPVHRRRVENWSGETVLEGVWTAEPFTPEDVVILADWAHAAGWRIRARGTCHGWSPLLLPAGQSPERTLLVDTTRHLTRLAIDPSGRPPTVTAQAGITLDPLLEALGEAGLGLAATPAMGGMTLGGALAVGAHGSALPGPSEAPVPGRSFGSLSNAVLALTAVVWDEPRRGFALRTFRRDDPAIGPLLVHLGRAFIVEATLQAAPDLPLRCRNLFHIPASVLFAPPGTAGADAFQSWVLAHGRAEVLWWPFTLLPWLKVWSPAPERPAFSRELREPYPYTFANSVTLEQSRFLEQVLLGHLEGTPWYQNAAMAAVGAGLILTGTWDVWGPSRFSTLYVRPSTLRVSEFGLVVLAARTDLQRVVSLYCRAMAGRLEDCRARGEYPMNGPLQIRVTGLDRAGEVALPGAREPLLSALRPRPDHPEWDCAIWLDAVTLPGTPGSAAFFAGLEAWVLATFPGARAEWAKGWAYTSRGAWTDGVQLGETLPLAYEAGQEGDGWAAALAGLDALDPHRVFSNPFLDRFLG